MKSRLSQLAVVCAGLLLVFVGRAWSDAVTNAAVEARLLEDLKYLASDECEGRGVLTQGLEKAAEHIAQRFKEAGLKPGVGDSYFQPFDISVENRLTGGETANRLRLKGPLGQVIALELGKHFTVLGFRTVGNRVRLSRIIAINTATIPSSVRR